MLYDHYLASKARKTKTDTDWEAYKLARNRCNGKIQKAKRKYHRDLIEENKKNPKFWEAIKSVFPSKSKSSIISMQKSKTRDMVSTFSKYFATVVSELKLRLGLSFSSYIWKPHYTQPRKINKSFAFSYISKVFVKKHLYL